jgi:anthranilate phosphoribosyltransferase
MDEVSICKEGTQVVELRDGEMLEYHLSAESFGLEPVSAKSISPPEGMSKGEFSLSILKGEISGPPLQMVLANASLLFYLAGYSSNLRACYQYATEVHKSGDAYSKVHRLQERLPIPSQENVEA